MFIEITNLGLGSSQPIFFPCKRKTNIQLRAPSTNKVAWSKNVLSVGVERGKKTLPIILAKEPKFQFTLYICIEFW
jgi:hypothetical protein